jgi:hypothetical protein
MVSDEVASAGMQFGTNSFDPHFDTKTIFGTDLQEIKKYQDYLLFENHAMPQRGIGRGNHTLSRLTWEKPVFVVSYRKGIGREHAYTQSDFDHIYSEAAAAQFFPCIKGSEYRTGAVWHNLQIEDYSLPRTDLKVSATTRKKKKHLVAKSKPGRALVRRYYNPLSRAYFEKRYIRRLLDPIYFRALG